MPYRIDNELELKFDTKKYPFDYKLLEWRLIINRQLYEEKVIDIKIFSEMEKILLGRMKRIRNNSLIQSDDEV